MNPIWIAGNAIAVVSTLVLMSYIRYERRFQRSQGLPWLSIVIIGVTAIITGLQFQYPEVLALFRRDLDGLRTGELWRLVTPVLVQPGGISQCVANAFLLILFVPLAERLYGKSLLILYFGAATLAQAFHYWWSSTGGGSSGAAFAVMGGLATYIFRNRQFVLKPFLILATVPLMAASVLAAFRDGHGPSLLIGALVAIWLPAASLTKSDSDKSPGC